jgi:ubiquinone/menaquinone biosynthesis C-methylase UbiE
MSGERGEAYIEYTNRFFDGWLPYYDHFARCLFFAYRAACDSIPRGGNRTVLDICTGTGEIAIRCARRGARVTGIDVTPSMLAKAREKSRGLDIELREMDARALTFADASFDTAVLSFALHDMPRRVRCQVLREALRVAAESVVILDYDVAGPRWLARVMARLIATYETAYLPAFAAEGVSPLLRELGQRDVAVRRFGPLPFAVFVVRPTRTACGAAQGRRSRSCSSSGTAS